MMWTANPNRTAAAPVEVGYKDGVDNSIKVNQKANKVHGILSVLMK